MTHPNRDKWKEIIGPDYDLMVKRYLVCINEIKRTTQEAQLVFPDSIQERILISNEAKPISLNDSMRILMKDDDVMKGLGAVEMLRVINNIEERLKWEPKKLFEDITRLAQALPEASRLFYEKVFACPNENHVKELRSNLLKMRKQKQQKFNKEAIKYFTAMLGGLLCQYMFRDLDRLLGDNSNDETLLSNTGFVRTFINSLNSLLSQIAFQNTIEELLEKGSEGDDESLFRAVRIDKTIVNNDILKHRIARANSSAEVRFLKRLGNNLAYNPLEKEAMYYEAYIVLRTFWKAGLILLKPKEMDNFLTACGIRHPSNPDTMKRTIIVRHIHPIYGT